MEIYFSHQAVQVLSVSVSSSSHTLGVCSRSAQSLANQSNDFQVANLTLAWHHS